MKHTLSILVENKPGVLTRVAGLFARRGFNIESLAVGLSEDSRLSRITIVIDGDEHPVDQVTKQLHKLINVLKIRDLAPDSSVSAELLLVRVAGLFARRGFNIESLAVGLSEDPRLSRITIVIDGDEHPVDQVTKQLHKLINVLKIRDLGPDNAVSAELLLVKVAGDGDKRSEALQIAEIFKAKIVDVDRRALTLRVVGTTDKVEALLELLQPLGILEVVRTGTIAMARGRG